METPAPASDNPASQTRRLIIFSDDWGRHPSSCQHLVGHLLDRYPTLWVNTIGTRRPKLTVQDLAKIRVKLAQWTAPASGGQQHHDHLTVLNPLMYPGFRTGWQRGLNAHLIARKVRRSLGARLPNEQRVAVTTVPVAADVVDRLDVDRWIYYCVDDFSVWPGLDGPVIDTMERRLVQKVERIATVSRNLQARVKAMGRQSVLLSHGIDLALWGGPSGSQEPNTATAPPPRLPGWWADLRKPILLFWGVVDQRLDTGCCLALSRAGGTLVLVGPHQSPDPRLADQPHIFMPGPVAYTDLPALARRADVLVMPYADLPVTRAIQPLKLKEYLATGKPTVVRSLPATRPWSDAADVVQTAEQFVLTATTRAAEGTPASQQQARRRLSEETWGLKAARFEHLLFG